MDYKERYEMWLHSPFFDKETKQELSLLGNAEIKERFYKELEFGTGGLRGIMGAGTNRMNIYTVSKVSLGISKYLIKTFGKKGIKNGVCIAYDTRINSRLFAEKAAAVFSSQGIKVYLYDFSYPTPVLSFSVKKLGCVAGVVITASHNPKEYNGYKLYDENGCQYTEDKTDKLIKYIDGIKSYEDIPKEKNDNLISKVGHELADDFCSEVLKLSIINNNEIKDNLKIVYTPLHGTGNIPVRRVLFDAGFQKVSVVLEQEQPDGNFPTVMSPNPEEKTTLEMGIAIAEALDSDIVIGTDPDCDRLGVAVKTSSGFQILSGNMVGALLAEFILSQKKPIKINPVIIKTIVTGEMGTKIAEDYGVKVIDTLTGFKNICAKMLELKESSDDSFIMGYEESCGYLVGEHTTDKDAVSATLLVCEMAAFYKSKNQTLFDVMDSLYLKYGFYIDAIDPFVLPGIDGVLRINELMAFLRLRYDEIFTDILKVNDYLNNIDDIPVSDVLKFFFNDGSWIAARPSGTEPKIKFYYSVCGSTMQEAEDKLEVFRKKIADLVD